MKFQIITKIFGFDENLYSFPLRPRLEIFDLQTVFDIFPNQNRYRPSFPTFEKEGKEVIFTILYEISNSSEIRLTLLGALYILYFLKAFRLLIIPEHQLVSHHRSKFLWMNKQVTRPAHYQNRLEQETRIPFQPPWPHLDASNGLKTINKKTRIYSSIK